MEEFAKLGSTAESTRPNILKTRLDTF